MKEVKGQDLWWHSEMKARMDMQLRMDPAEPVVADGVGAGMPAWDARLGCGGEQPYFGPRIAGGGGEFASVFGERWEKIRH